MMFSGFDFVFSLFPILFLIVFAIVIGTFITTGIKGAKQWKHNNDSPRLTVAASVVNKREQVGRTHHHHDSHTHTYHYTNYFVTFEVESGDRMELEVSGEESGLMVEGDQGMLTFQGTRFLGFERSL